ncbi:hypothetical protein CW304_23780 [Bacillus sp. UFRGS-B20]|nr:hypothetical protein CW304_23780 [Bacillus sp. UFRGS-B20]
MCNSKNSYIKKREGFIVEFILFCRLKTFSLSLIYILFLAYPFRLLFFDANFQSVYASII